MKVHFAGGEFVEVIVEPEDVVRQLCRRVADIKDAGWATLLIGSETLAEELLVSSIPHGQIVTAVLQNSWERPDRLSQTVRKQMRQFLGKHGVGSECIEEGFQQNTWEKFRVLIEIEGPSIEEVRKRRRILGGLDRTCIYYYEEESEEEAAFLETLTRAWRSENSSGKLVECLA